jgi:hypothetical protein
MHGEVDGKGVYYPQLRARRSAVFMVDQGVKPLKKVKNASPQPTQSMGLKPVKSERNGQRAWHVFLSSKLWGVRLG